MIERQTVFVAQTIRCASGAPIIGVFSSVELYTAFLEKQAPAARPHIVMYPIQLDVESVSLLRFEPPTEFPEAEGKAPTQTL